MIITSLLLFMNMILFTQSDIFIYFNLVNSNTKIDSTKFDDEFRTREKFLSFASKSEKVTNKYAMTYIKSCKENLSFELSNRLEIIRKTSICLFTKF